MFDLKVVTNADTIERGERDVLVIHRGEDVIVYKRKISAWRILVDVLVNGNPWCTNWEVDDEVQEFWAAALERELQLSEENHKRAHKENLAAAQRLRGHDPEEA